MKLETKNNTKLDRFIDTLEGTPSYSRGVKRDGLGVAIIKGKKDCWIKGERVNVGHEGIRALELLCKLYLSSGQVLSVPVLRGVAKHVRTIDLNGTGKGIRRLLNSLIKHTLLDDRRRLFVWLRGRLGGRSGAGVIGQFSSHPDWRMRKEVARALKRLQGWPELRELSEKESHPKVVNIAAQVHARAFDERLGDFCESVAPRKISQVFSRRLFVDDSVSFARTKPKSLEVLRMLLQRISTTVKDACRVG